MVKRLQIKLSEDERQILENHRNRDARPYMRERCAALLQIADGQTARQVALHNTYRRRKTDTVYEWVHRYQKYGIEGLYIRKGRGRKPAFFPSP